MWRRRPWRFYFGFPPIGSYSHGFRPFPGEKEYLEMLDEYKKDLEEELTAVEKEIEETKERVKQRRAKRPPTQ